MVEKTDKIWMDGKLVAWDDATVHVLTHTLHYGMGIFEGIRCYKTPKGPAIFRLKEHVRRLFDSAHILQMVIPFSKDDIEAAIVECVKINGLQECYIRPFVYIGYGAMGVHPKGNPINVSISSWAWGSYLGEDGVKNGIRVKTSSFIRNHVNSNMSRGKISGYYVNSQLAKREALSMGFDEALLLDAEGYVAEGAGENIFVVRNGVIKTTPLTSILEGITRDSVITIAANEKVPLEEKRFTRDELYISDEAFFTGTAAEVTPIREVDSRKIGSGKPGSVTKRIQEIFFDSVHGLVDKYSHWLTYI
ncbi:MAG: branched-chain amino acid transaminase [Nitrospirae bacterium]|uniref:branched-chain amino acid transaminase n=1 Tax=Candidatus Magnetobacterium casense TaxID=1455061 RepID=UPI0005905650|nr:branched-chain amino acid transaminase [Candidatus Magnetobacterium casensis]MBF0337202.1 branched-chain amino acid transaminase [Nitrospirota bacterium]